MEKYVHEETMIYYVTAIFVELFRAVLVAVFCRLKSGKNGYICEEDMMPYPINKEGKYLFADFEGAVNAIVEIEDYIKRVCSDAGIVWQEMGIYFTIKLFRIKPPSHLFTEEEIRNVLRMCNNIVYDVL